MFDYITYFELNLYWAGKLKLMLEISTSVETIYAALRSVIYFFAHVGKLFEDLIPNGFIPKIYLIPNGGRADKGIYTFLFP